jgi:putative DNA primase/helicase
LTTDAAPNTRAVASIMDDAEDVGLPDSLTAASPHQAPPYDDNDPGPDPEDAGYDRDPDMGEGHEPPDPPDEGDGIDWGRVEAASALPLHDVGNGLRFQLHHGENARFVPNMGWHIWDDTRWKFDPPAVKDMPGGVATRKLSHTMSEWIARECVFLRPRDQSDLQQRQQWIAARLMEMEAVPSKARTTEARTEIDALRREKGEIEEILARAQDRVAQRLRHAKQAGNTATLNNMLKEGGVNLAVTVDQLDADALKVNCLNGTLHFTVALDGKFRRASVEFRPHDRADLITKRMDVAYDPDAIAPTFRAFINQIQPEPEVQGYLQRLFGLSMLAVIEQVIFFLHGDGANGKSVLVDLIHRMLSDYAAKAKIESLTGTNRRSGGDATPDLVPLIGARMATTSEPGEGVSWQEGLIKEMTGGEPMLIRALQEGFVEILPYFKPIVSGNHKPVFKGTDDGIWRRVKLIEFPVQIPEADRRPKQEMDAELFGEASGVLNWMVQGALAYLEGGLMEPAQVRNATSALREESDPYGAFLDEACEVTGEDGDRIGAAELVNAFNYWLTARGEGHYRDRTIAKAMAGHARRWRSKKTGQKFAQVKSGGRMFYDGLRFTAFFKKDWEASPKDQRGRALTVGAVPDNDSAAADYIGDF